MTRAIEGTWFERAGVRLHYLDYGGEGPRLLLLHGLTANARSFDGLMAAGLSRHARVVALDLRGRGQSDQPDSGYTIADHAADVVALLDQLRWRSATLGGHSFGGLVSLYLAHHEPKRIDGLALLDIAGPTVKNPATFELLQPSLDRLGEEYPSMPTFLGHMRCMPFLCGMWNEALETFYRADVEPAAGGRVRVRTRAATIQQVIESVVREDWSAHIAAAHQPALLLHATGAFGPPGTAALVLPEQAAATVSELRRCQYAQVPGNHMTMLFEDGAASIVEALAPFLRRKTDV